MTHWYNLETICNTFNFINGLTYKNYLIKVKNAFFFLIKCGKINLYLSHGNEEKYGSNLKFILCSDHLSFYLSCCYQQRYVIFCTILKFQFYLIHNISSCFSKTCLFLFNSSFHPLQKKLSLSKIYVLPSFTPRVH